MTVLVVFVEPPREGVLPRLVDTSPLSSAEAARLYRAMAADAVDVAAASGGDLLVHYPPSEEYDGTDPGVAAREIAAEAGVDPEDARFEVQVGSSFAARAGNAVTHLLETEDADSVAVLDATTPMLRRTDVDSAAMRLRRHEVVLGPAERGRVSYAGFTEPVDFEDAYDPPAVETLTERAADAGHDVDFLPQRTKVETGDDLLTLCALVRAREAAGSIVPERTAACVRELGLRAEDGGGGDAELVRASTDRP